MKTIRTKDKLAEGVDQRFKGNPDGAQLIKNMRVEDTGLGWVADRGWEAVFAASTSGQETITDSDRLDLQEPTRFLKVWTRHGGAEVYHLFERNGILRYFIGSDTEVQLKTGRNLPKANDPGTQLTPFGRFALVQNGYDRPFKFWGREKTTPFGWSQRPNSPNVFSPEPSYILNPKDTTKEECAYVIGLSDRQTGLGNTELGDYSHYRYKVSYISDTGSESPLSDSKAVAWLVENAGEESRFGIPVADIPIGPEGTVARRIYRSKNLENNSAEIYYLVKQLNDNVVTEWMDILPDSLLLEQAPSSTASILLPQSFKYAASWNGVMWLAGGDDLPTKIHYSERYLPEQFSSFRFFDVGTRATGGITAVVPYNNALIVFRENSIEVISAIGEDSYTIGTLTTEVGTTATNTIVAVPGVGLMFLTQDGVYAIQGALSGSGQVNLKVSRISQVLHREWKRLSSSSLPRASATYSKREKEYWVHYPSDGETENNRGAVFHIQNEQWSLRNLSEPNITLNGNAGHGMYFTQLDVDQNGWIIMGTYPNYPYKNPSTANLNAYPGYGLQVWSASEFFGQALNWVSTGAGDALYDVVDIQKGSQGCQWISTYQDFGDSVMKKRILSIEIQAVTQGYNEIDLVYKKDHGFVSLSSGAAVGSMLHEQYKTTGSEPVWAGANVASDIKNIADWGTVWSNDQICRMRWDIKTDLVGEFCWGLQSQYNFHIISFSIEYEISGQKNIFKGGSRNV